MAIVSAGAFALAATACEGATTIEIDRPTVIEGATVLSGRSLKAIPGAVVVISNGRIATVGAADETQIPAGAERIDARGLTLLPGFIDAHVHIGFYDPGEILRNGVTTVRDLGWPPDLIFDLAERSRSAGFDGPSIFPAGPMLTAPGGYPMGAGWAPPGTGLEISNEQVARDSVRSLADRGATVIKVALNPPAGPTLSPGLLDAIVDEAHERGLKVTGHVYGLDELDKAIASGVDELAHMLMSNERIPDATLEKMVESSMAIVPTLSIRYGNDRRTAIENLKRFHAAGGTVVYGTDLGNEGPRPGIDPLELEGLVEAGLSPLEVISIATVRAAEWLGLPDLGTIAEGMHADMIAVRGDPTTDVSALLDIAMVWRRGVRAR